MAFHLVVVMMRAMCARRSAASASSKYRSVRQRTVANKQEIRHHEEDAGVDDRDGSTSTHRGAPRFDARVDADARGLALDL